MAARQGRQEQGAEDFQGSTTATVCPRRRTLVPTHRTDTSDPDTPCPGAEAPSSRRALTGVPAGGGEAAPGVAGCPTLCDLMNFTTPGLPVHHQLLEPTQTHVH